MRSPPAACPLPLLLLLLGTSALAAAPPCSPAPPSVGSVQELVRRAAVVIEGKVLPREAARPAGLGEAGLPQGRRPGQPTAPAAGTLPPSPPPPPAASASPAPPPWVARVRVHQVWAVKGGGLRKDSLFWLRGEPGSACGRLKAESRYIFFMEPLDAGAALFQASSPPLETGRYLKREVSRALCRGC
ncbi:hypothetical protein KIL84_013149, partial [Mauremys mutica]